MQRCTNCIINNTVSGSLCHLFLWCDHLKSEWKIYKYFLCLIFPFLSHYILYYATYIIGIIILPTLNGRYHTAKHKQFQVILSTFLVEKQKKLWLILEPDYRLKNSSEMFLASDLDKVFRLILVLPDADLDFSKRGNFLVGEFWC